MQAHLKGRPSCTPQARAPRRGAARVFRSRDTPFAEVDGERKLRSWENGTCRESPRRSSVGGCPWSVLGGPARKHPTGRRAQRTARAERRRKDRTRRIHRGREPQLQQPFSRLSGRIYCPERKGFKGVQNDRVKAGRFPRQCTIDYSSRAMFEACPGTGKFPGRSAAWTVSTAKKCRRTARGQVSDVRLRAARRIEAVLRMAHQWVLADRMFQSQLDESFVAHQYVIAAQAQSTENSRSVFGDARGVRETSWRRSSAIEHGASERPASIIRRSPTSSTMRELSWRFYTSTYGARRAASAATGRRIKRSSTSTTVPIGRKTS